MKVQARSGHVSGGQLHLADPVLSLEGAKERLLGKVVGLVRVAGQQEERLAEPLLVLKEELLEGRGVDEEPRHGPFRLVGLNHLAP
jgi:hypothetical protein